LFFFQDANITGWVEAQYFFFGLFLDELPELLFLSKPSGWMHREGQGQGAPKKTTGRPFWWGARLEKKQIPC